MVQGVAQVGEVLTHKPVPVVAEDTGDRGRDTEGIAFEGEDEDGVWGKQINFRVNASRGGEERTGREPYKSLAQVLVVVGVVVDLPALPE